MTIFDALRKDHDTQRNLVDRLIATQGDSNERETLFEQLKVELQTHANAEERCFYIPLLEHDMTQEKSRHSIAEHHDLDELIESLEATDYSASNWLKIAKDLHHKVYHHLEEEEQEVFQMAGKVLQETQKNNLADAYEKEMSEQRNELS